MRFCSSTELESMSVNQSPTRYTSIPSCTGNNYDVTRHNNVVEKGSATAIDLDIPVSSFSAI